MLTKEDLLMCDTPPNIRDVSNLLKLKTNQAQLLIQFPMNLI